jgi:hypothetical protein
MVLRIDHIHEDIWQNLHKQHRMIRCFLAKINTKGHLLVNNKQKNANGSAGNMLSQLETM